MAYALSLASFKTDHVLFFAVKLNSAKVISFSGHQFSELEYLRILKNAGLKDPLEKAFSTSLIAFHERVIEEFCP